MNAANCCISRRHATRAMTNTSKAFHALITSVIMIAFLAEFNVRGMSHRPMIQARKSNGIDNRYTK